MPTDVKTYDAKSYELLCANKRVLELMAKNHPLDEILVSIVKTIETFAPGARAAVYFVADHKLVLGAAPSFPDSFTSVVDGCPIGINHGVCGTASFTGERTISTNVAQDAVWGNFTDWVLSFGINSAFSTPVLTTNNTVIATVSLYYQHCYQPTPWDFEIVEVAANLMAIAVERKKQEELINDQRLKLVTSSRLAALGEMAANLAHEINNPLAIIQNHATFLRLLSKKNKISVQEVEASSEEIEKTVNRASAIIKGLKVISKDGDNDPFQTVSVRTLLDDTLSFCRERFHRNGIKLIVVPVDNGLSISCRSVQLSQALLNLLNNAFDATVATSDKWIRIEVAQSQKNCLISVIDSGNGIPTELKNKIMDPFFTTKGTAHGTGLGLSISRKIVEAHQGSLSINEESPNTRFDISIPLGGFYE